MRGFISPSVAGVAVALACGVALTAPASAGSFRINPVQIKIPSGRQAALVRMTNHDPAGAVSIRVSTYAWTQIDGRDVYSPTTNVIVSPPIFTVPAGQTQIVRVGVRNPAGAGAYRVVFEEIPRDGLGNGQVQITLRMDLPLYLLPSGPAKPQLSWAAWRDAAGDIVVEGRNGGSLHGQIIELAVQQGGKSHLLSNQMGVILPGSARQWKIGKRPELMVGVPMLLTVKGSTGETPTPIVLERR